MRASPLTSLGLGICWPLLDAGLLGCNLVAAQPTLQQWPAWARNPRTWRVRRQDEMHEPVAPGSWCYEGGNWNEPLTDLTVYAEVRA